MMLPKRSKMFGRTNNYLFSDETGKWEVSFDSTFDALKNVIFPLVLLFFTH